MSNTSDLLTWQEIWQPIAYIPQTIGWLVLLTVLLLTCALFGWLAWRRYHINQYRREALAKLDAIELRLHASPPDRQVLSELPVLVKRTALSFAPRTQVAALSGDNWLIFLDRTAPGVRFATGPGRLLWRLVYAPECVWREIPPNDIDALCALLRRWIQRHTAI